MPNEFVARNGIIALNNSIITGSLNVTQGVTASLQGTASWANNALSSSYILSAVSASFASTASNVLGGAANYVPLWNGATTLSSSVIYQSSGNIGIGTTSPAYKLEVNGGAVGNNIVRFTTGGGGGGTRGMTIYSNDSYVKLQVTDNAGSIGTWAHLVLNPDNGNVGIGTTSPNAKLDVNGNAIVTGSLTVTGTITAQTLVVQTVTSSVSFITGSTRFGSLLANTHEFTGSVGMTGSLSVMGGNVGIGTTTPGEKLHVLGSQIIGNSTYDTAYGYYLRFPFQAGNLTAGTIRSHIQFDSILDISVNVNDTWKWKIAAVARAGNSGNYNSSLEFMRTTRTGVTDETVLALNGSTGNVGIGTTSPSARLHVSGSTTTNLLVGTSDLFVSASGNVGIGTITPAYTLTLGNDKFISFNNDLGNPFGIGGGDNAMTRIVMGASSGAASSIQFGVGSSGLYAGFTSLMTIKPSGNVGIATTTPNAKLDVNGNTIITGSLTVITGSAIELQVLNTGVRIGNIVTDTHTVTGSLNVSGSITGSLFGTASFAVSASWAPGGSGGTVSEPIPAAAKLYLFYNY